MAWAGVVAVLVVGLASSPAGARTLAGATTTAGGWGKAERVPGTSTGVLGSDNDAIYSVSCASPGNCTAGGGNASSTSQAFVISQVNGTWRTAEVVPGLAALNQGKDASVTAVSCASAGNCSAGGDYWDASHRSHAFVVSQVHGIWGQAEAVPGLAALNGGDQAQIISVSCASAGNCTAGGSYTDSSRTQQAFVVSQVNGTWRKAEAVPGLGLNVNGASVGAVSCASAGNCTAGGFYTDAGFAEDSFVVSQVHGTWGQAESLPRAHLSQDVLGDSVDTLSCPSAGNCTVGGDYVDFNTNVYVYVDSEVDGTWGQAEQVPGTAAVSGGDMAGISVSCASAGNCSAGGSYTGSDGHQQAFVDSQVGGTWGPAREVPGLPRLNTGRDSAIGALSCVSAGNCSAGGSYTDSSGAGQAFVVSQVGGKWGEAEEVAGFAALNGRDPQIDSVSCASASHCSAGGAYLGPSGTLRAFVVSRT
jgi:D-alanine-D-alanine ligase-like ATP-grasp enzyme